MEKEAGQFSFRVAILNACIVKNFEISHQAKGNEISPKGLAEIFKDLEKRGAANINLVTPTHFAYEIVEALEIYRPKIPIVWNTSGYEEVETIKKNFKIC